MVDLLTRDTTMKVAQASEGMPLETYAPAMVLVDCSYRTLHFSGPTDRYLRVAPGEPSRDVVAMRRGQARRLGRAGRHLRLGTPSGRCCGSPRAQEHHPPGARLPGSRGCRQKSISTSSTGPAAPRQAVDANMSGDQEQEYFADGMVEEIITALSRIRWLFVIARASRFTYKGQAIDVRRVGGEVRALSHTSGTYLGRNKP